MTREVDHLVIHCSATGPRQDIGAADIDRMHRARGFWGCGYHIVIRRDGTIETERDGHRCRPLSKSGAHVGGCGPGWNKRSIGICMVGGVNSKGKATDNFTEAQWKSLEEVVLSILEEYPSINKLGGHRDLIKLTGASPKDCPSTDIGKWWLEVREKYGESYRYVELI